MEEYKVMIKRYLLAIVLLLPTLLSAQFNPTIQDSQTGPSGTTLVFIDGRSLSGTFEYIISGGPATASIVLSGCMRSATCETLDTYTGLTNTIRRLAGLATYTGPYDYYQVAITFTGGTSPALKVNRLGVVAKGNGAPIIFSSLGVYSVLAYGAKCDGVTDDTTPLSNAQTAANAAGGGILQLPAGTCITSTVTGLSNVWWRGVGEFITTLKLKNGTNSHLLSFVEKANYAISDMTLEGNSSNQSGTSYDIYITNQSVLNPDWQLARLFVTHAKTDGIHIDAASSGNGHAGPLDVYFNDGVGLNTGARDTTWESLNIGQSGLQGLIFNASSQHATDIKSWFSGRLTPASGNGIEVNGGLSKIHCANCEAQDNQAAGFKVRGSDHVFTGFIANGNGQGATGDGFIMVSCTSCYAQGAAPAAGDLPTAQRYALNISTTSTGNTIDMTSSNNTTGLVTGDSIPGNNIRVIDAAGTTFVQNMGPNTNNCVSAPGTPAAGYHVIYCDSTNKILSDKNDAGTVSNTVVPSSAGASQYASSVSAAGVIGYTALPNASPTLVHSLCSGTATPSVTLAMFGLGTTATSCTGTAVNAQATAIATAGTVYNLTVAAATGGVNASSGVFTVNKNSVGQTLTCTTGTATTCTDTSHSFTVVQGDKLTVTFTTQAAETLANIAVSFAIRN